MPTCEERLRHAKSIGFNPSEIVDAGAYVGGWTKMASTLFPDSRCLVIEPNPYVQEQLVSTLADLKDKAVLVAKALGEEPGSLLFNIWGDPNEATSASLQSHVRGDPDTSMTVDVATLDGLLKAHRLKPDLVKLDLQGAEYGALMGATAALKSVEMFIVEFGCLDAYIDRTTPRQLMEVFYDNDYCLYDVVDCHYRPYDGALTGGDFFFVKNDSPLREHKGWD
jgi:FkbM family methyltransferase